MKKNPPHFVNLQICNEANMELVVSEEHLTNALLRFHI